MADQIHPLQRFMKEADDLVSKVCQHRDTQDPKILEYYLKRIAALQSSLSTLIARKLHWIIYTANSIDIVVWVLFFRLEKKSMAIAG